jgi:hypothetical protein
LVEAVPAEPGSASARHAMVLTRVPIGSMVMRTSSPG